MTNLDKLNFKWEIVGSISPHELVNARGLLHHSVQLIAAAGKHLIPERPDDSHTSLHWNKDKEAFEGETIGETGFFRIGLLPASLTVYIIQNNQDKIATFPLQESTLNSALSWLKSEIDNRGLDASNLNLKMHYEIPHHDIAGGKLIKLNPPDHFVEIGRYFANANHVLHGIKAIIQGTGDIRCWPHHFDIATIIKIDKEKSAEEARSIGIGLSPGDGGYEEPYFYITPWPYPDVQKLNLPELQAGKWHTAGWVGAVLLASEICPQSDQTQFVSDFIKSGISVCAELLNHKL